MQKEDIATKIFIDGGEPEETKRAKELLGWLDGQTTNPSLIAKRYKEGVRGSRFKVEGKMTEEEALEGYKKTVQEMSKIIPDGSISIQVFANRETTAEEMIKQAKARVKWIPNASIKLACTKEGLKAAEVLCKVMPINITLVFSQSQTAAVYEATREANYPVFVSPFVGRLDDRGEVGMDLVKNILRMFQNPKSKAQNPKFISQNTGAHVQVLTASIRNLDHLLYALHLGSDIATIPFKIFEEWADTDFKLPEKDYKYDAAGLRPIPYEESIKLGRHWQSYNLYHPLTEKGIIKFWEDWNLLFKG